MDSLNPGTDPNTLISAVTAVILPDIFRDFPQSFVASVIVVI
jgi:hypothetical protein